MTIISIDEDRGKLRKYPLKTQISVGINPKIIIIYTLHYIELFTLNIVQILSC